MTLEESIMRQKGQQFAKDCAEAFATPAGRRVLGALCNAAHPLGPRFSHANPDPTRAAIEDGRREVVACLWRFGSGSAAMPQPQPEKTDA